MSEQAVFDLILLGYRNELARERVIALIGRLRDVHPFEPVRRDSVLPLRVATDLDHDLGLKLCAQLRQSGAQVRLVGAEEILRKNPVRESTNQRSNVRLLFLVLLLGIAAWLHNHQQDSGLGAIPGMSGAARMRRTSLKLNSEAIELSERGEFSAAADRLNNAIKQEPNEPTLRQNLRAVLHNWAVAELNDGHPDRAATIANQALSLGTDPRLYLVLGVAQSRLGQWDQAQKALEQAVQLGGNDAQTVIALGKVYRETGNREGAVEMFQRARDLGIGGSDFDTALGRLERELDAEWDYTELPSPHFTISFAAGRNDDAARNVTESLEDAYDRVGRKLDFYGSDRIPVVLYDEEEFHDITQAPQWMGALYDGRIKIPVRGLDERTVLLDRTVRHEYAHAVVSQLTHGRCPVWLNEGVAIWAEEQTDGERVEWAQRTISDQELFHLAALEQPFTNLSTERVPVAYAQSYLAVRAILDADGAPRIRALLTAIGSGMTLADAFDSALSRSLPDFEAGLVQGLTG